MEVRLLERDKEKGKLSFIVKDGKAAFANAIRRIIVEEVSTMAIEDVEFRKNSSVLYDEIIANRLGLIPMTTDLKSYTPPEKCKCEGKGCSHCQLKLTLKAKGPCMIYASDLKSRDPAVKPVYPKIPIVKLLKNQSLELEATAVLGHGKAHAKWIPCLVWYKKKPRIEVGNVKNPEEVVEATHGKIFEIKNNKLEIIREDIFKYDLVNAAEKVSKGEIRAEYEDDYIFYIESWGQLEPKKILLEALRLLKEKFDQVEDKISIK